MIENSILLRSAVTVVLLLEHLQLPLYRDISDRLQDVTFKTGADVAQQKGLLVFMLSMYQCVLSNCVSDIFPIWFESMDLSVVPKLLSLQHVVA